MIIGAGAPCCLAPPVDDYLIRGSLLPCLAGDDYRSRGSLLPSPGVDNIGVAPGSDPPETHNFFDPHLMIF